MQLLGSQLKNTTETEEIKVTHRMSFINNAVKPNPLFKLNTWTRDLLPGQLFSVLVQQISKIYPQSHILLSVLFPPFLNKIRSNTSRITKK